MDFEEILKCIGDYGIYQKKLVYFILIPYSLFLPWAYGSTMFMVYTPKFGCRVPELQQFRTELQFIITEPSAIDNPKPSICQMLDINYKKLINDLDLNSQRNETEKIKKIIQNYFKHNEPSYKPCDQGYIYDKSDYDETAVTAFDLVCDRESLANNVLSICGLGSICGTVIFGCLSDKLGRQKTMLIINIIFIVGTFSPTFIKGYYAFLISRFLISSVINTIFQIPFILVTELVSPDQRTIIGFFVTIAWGIGICVLPAFMYFFRHWVYMNHVITLTGVFYLVSYFWISESPRWLLVSGKLERAAKILKKIAIINKMPDAKNEDFIQKLNMVSSKSDPNNPSTKGEDSLLPLITNRKIRRLFLNITLGYCSNSLAYNAINLNTFSLSGNQFLNYFLLSVIEIPAAYAAYIMMETPFGRRLTGSLFLLIFAVLNLISIMIDNFTVIIALNVICKLFISFIPETLNQKLPQTIRDAEVFGENNKFWSLAETKNKKEDQNDTVDKAIELKSDQTILNSV